MVASLALVEEAVTELIPVVLLNAIVRPKGDPTALPSLSWRTRPVTAWPAPCTITLGDAFLAT